MPVSSASPFLVASRRQGGPGPGGRGAGALLNEGDAAHAGVAQQLVDGALRLLGADAMLYGSYEMVRPDTAMESNTVAKAFLRARANSIEGGTSEVQLNVVAKRILGLPGA